MLFFKFGIFLIFTKYTFNKMKFLLTLGFKLAHSCVANAAQPQGLSFLEVEVSFSLPPSHQPGQDLAASIDPLHELVPDGRVVRVDLQLLEQRRTSERAGADVVGERRQRVELFRRGAKNIQSSYTSSGVKVFVLQ